MNQAESYGNLSANIEFLQMVGLLQPGMDIVEIGAGNGNMIAHLRERGIVVQGTEVNAERIHTAKKEFAVLLTRLNGTVLPFVDFSQDVALSFDVFEHIPNTAAHLAEVSRILRPGGSYIFSTPNKVTNYPFEVLRNKSLTKHNSYHPSLKFYWKLKKDLNQAGFDSVFFKVPVGVDFIEKKLERFFGPVGKITGKVVPFSFFPIWARPNFYVHAKKQALFLNVGKHL